MRKLEDWRNKELIYQYVSKLELILLGSVLGAQTSDKVEKRRKASICAKGTKPEVRLYHAHAANQAVHMYAAPATRVSNAKSGAMKKNWSQAYHVQKCRRLGRRFTNDRDTIRFTLAHDFVMGIGETRGTTLSQWISGALLRQDSLWRRLCGGMEQADTLSKRDTVKRMGYRWSCLADYADLFAPYEEEPRELVRPDCWNFYAVGIKMGTLWLFEAEATYLWIWSPFTQCGILAWRGGFIHWRRHISDEVIEDNSAGLILVSSQFKKVFKEIMSVCLQSCPWCQKRVV